VQLHVGQRRRIRETDRPQVQHELGQEGLHGHGHRRVHRLLPLHSAGHGSRYCSYRKSVYQVLEVLSI
jgi:hypothetical protein